MKKPDANPKPKKFERSPELLDEGDELFDCEGDKLVINEHNEEHQSDKENDANVETGAIENQDENDQVNVNTVNSSNILLGDLC